MPLLRTHESESGNRPPRIIGSVGVTLTMTGDQQYYAGAKMVKMGEFFKLPRHPAGADGA